MLKWIKYPDHSSPCSKQTIKVILIKTSSRIGKATETYTKLDFGNLVDGF